MSKDTKIILWISFLGFCLSGVLVYPYGIMRDNMLLFAEKIFLGQPPDNWMGWFVPALQKLTYQITKLPHSIGFLHNILYWLAMPLIFLRWIKPAKHSLACYLVFAFSPAIFIMMMNISNNVLLLSFIAAALASFRMKNHFLWVIFLVCAALTRRDALLIALPLAALMTAQAFRPKAVIPGLALFLLFVIGISKPIENKNPAYGSRIDSISLINSFNLVGMSYLKNELLIPPHILSPRYQNDPAAALERIKKLPDIYNDEYFYRDFDLFNSGYWTSGLTLKESFPIYWNNLFLALRFRLGVLSGFLFRTGDLSYTEKYDEDILLQMGLSEYPMTPPLIEKIQFARKALGKVLEKTVPFFFQEWFYLVLALLSGFMLARYGSLFSPEDRFFCWGLLGTGLLFFALMSIAVVTVMFRFVMPANFLLWIVFVKTAAAVLPRWASPGQAQEYPGKSSTSHGIL